jgi:hypothetical protein
MSNIKLSIRQQAIRRAAEILGEPRKLARRLRVPTDELVRWINGKGQPSNASFLECVDIILENEDSIDGGLLQDAAGAAEAAPGKEPDPKR